MQKANARQLDADTHDYLVGLRLGLIDLGYEIYADTWKSRSSAVALGYRDAIDDSDDMPDPIDLEETLVP